MAGLKTDSQLTRLTHQSHVCMRICNVDAEGLAHALHCAWESAPNPPVAATTRACLNPGERAHPDLRTRARNARTAAAALMLSVDGPPATMTLNFVPCAHLVPTIMMVKTACS